MDRQSRPESPKPNTEPEHLSRKVQNRWLRVVSIIIVAAATMSLGESNPSKANANCQFQVTPTGDFRSSQVTGTVPVSEILIRGSQQVPLEILVNPWKFCAPNGANGMVGLTRKEGDEKTAVVKQGNKIHIERLMVHELLPSYKGPAPKAVDKIISAMGPCDADVDGANNARINCTILRGW